MPSTYNVYCDESCHLENDHQGIMVLGAVWCPVEHTREISESIRVKKQEWGLSRGFEIKWTKVSPAKLAFYLNLLDLFFDDDDLHFRALVAPDKSALRHPDFQQTHDEWYYKMYFNMLKIIFEPHSRYRVYLDIKDTRGGEKVSKLHDVLCSNAYDFSRQIIERVQLIRSHESELMQLADLLIGTVSYANRDIDTSDAKLQLVERMRQRSGYTLNQPTLYQEKKVNLFVWQAS